MDEVRSFEGTSVFSSVTGVPAYITAQYTPLAGVLRRTDVEFPDRREPEPNSQAMVRALKALQRKIQSLELEKEAVDNTFKCLAEETRLCRKLRHLDRDSTPNLPLPNHELQEHLDENSSEDAYDKRQMEGEPATRSKHTDCQAQGKTHVQACDNVHHIRKSFARGIGSGVSLCHHCRAPPGIHYRLNLRDVPFLLTASTSPSHSVTANYQQVLASMKCHSALCGVVASGKVKSPKREADFKSLLKSLEEEFGRLTFEHQQHAEQLATKPADSSTNPHEHEKYLQLLADQIESKAKQISIVSRQISAHGVHHKPSPTRRAAHVKMDSPKVAGVKFLKNMKVIRSTLQKEDLSWD